MHIEPEPSEALPATIFDGRHTMRANGEDLVLQSVPPAHTDTDIHVTFAKAGVVHLGDLFFNGSYPFIDGVTGGTMNGMVAAADAMLKVVGASTRIVPGHGPLADRAALQRYHTMLATVRDRIGKGPDNGGDDDRTEQHQEHRSELPHEQRKGRERDHDDRPMRELPVGRIQGGFLWHAQVARLSHNGSEAKRGR
jgi:glyoxylase-like metal-dependent hydrolase (beta-lactamase superfamily II)